MSNRDYFINYLRFWWNATPSKALFGSVGFSNALAFYDKDAYFIESIGKTVRSIPQDKVKRAFESLAEQHGTNYPPKTAFYDALVAEVGTLSFTDVKDIAVESAEEIGTLAKYGLGIWAAIAGVGALLVILSFRKKGGA